MFDYNNFGSNRELVKDFIKTHQKEILNVIYKDTTENNPIALITRNRTSSIFLYELVENIDWSKENIEKQPGLKMLTTSLKIITPSVYNHPSDFVVLLTEKLNKYEQKPRNNICRTLWDNSRPECHFGKEIFERQNLQ